MRTRSSTHKILAEVELCRHGAPKIKCPLLSRRRHKLKKKEVKVELGELPVLQVKMEPGEIPEPSQVKMEPEQLLGPSQLKIESREFPEQSQTIMQHRDFPGPSQMKIELEELPRQGLSFNDYERFKERNIICKAAVDMILDDRYPYFDFLETALDLECQELALNFVPDIENYFSEIKALLDAIIALRPKP